MLRRPSRFARVSGLAAAAPAAALLALLLHVSPAPAAPAKPVALTAAERDSLARAIEKGRADENEWLKSGPTSYLATVLRVDFLARRSLVLGRAADCDVRVDDPEMPEHALRATVVGDSFRVEALDEALAPVAAGQPVRDALLPPSTLKLGRWSVRLSHQRFPAIIVFDPKSPRYADWKPMPWHPVDLAWRFVAPLVPNPKADTVIVLSTRGNERRAVRVGWFDLAAKGRRFRLEAHRLLEPGVDEKAISIFFRDALAGTGTYDVGRYLDPEELPDGRWLLDFNLAYNPACAWSDHYNCPIPSKANTLKFAIPVGAKHPHMHAH